MTLTADELLAGSSLTHEVDIPADLLGEGVRGGRIVLRPLTVRDLQRISKASRSDDSLSAALMIQQAMVAPEMKTEEVTRLPAGLARFLVEKDQRHQRNGHAPRRPRRACPGTPGKGVLCARQGVRLDA